MFTVKNAISSQYTQYILEDLTAKTKAIIVPHRGGILSSFSVNNEEFIYFDEENFYSNERPKGGMPILFPCCGRTNDEKYTVLEKEYPMPIHGIAHTSTFNVKEYNHTQGANITLEFSSNEETKQYYPFDFKATYTYSLQGNRLTLTQCYRNEGIEEMPFGFGLHPYFNISSLENLELNVKAMGALSFTTGSMESYTNPVKMPILSESSAMFIGAKEKVICVDKVLGHKVEVAFDENYHLMMLWALKDKNFLCIEPWNDVPNALNTGAKNLLKPGEELRASMSISISII